MKIVTTLRWSQYVQSRINLSESIKPVGEKIWSLCSVCLLFPSFHVRVEGRPRFRGGAVFAARADPARVWLRDGTLRGTFTQRARIDDDGASVTTKARDGARSQHQSGLTLPPTINLRAEMPRRDADAEPASADADDVDGAMEDLSLIHI